MLRTSLEQWVIVSFYTTVQLVLGCAACPAGSYDYQFGFIFCYGAPTRLIKIY